MSELVSEKTIAAVEEMEARQAREADMRLEVIREICRKEGHGELIEYTRFEDAGMVRRFICQRGCGIAVFELVRSMTVDEMNDWLARGKLTGTVRLRGRIEVEQ